MSTQTYNLTVFVSPANTGTIAVNASQPATQPNYYPAGTVITLTATPSAQATFSKYRIAVGTETPYETSDNPKSFTLTNHSSVAATFITATPPAPTPTLDWNLIIAAIGAIGGLAALAWYFLKYRRRKK